MDYMPFNSVDHDRVYKAEDWAWYFSTFISNGVFPSPSDGLQVLASDAMTVSVRPGYGFINGYAFRNTAAKALTIGTADGSLARIDRIVLRWDLADRLMGLYVLAGTAARNPSAPALTRSADIWELALADIRVNAGTTTITQAMITDDRYTNSLCGICAGVIDQIDADTLTRQFRNFFDGYEAEISTEYTKYTDKMAAYQTAWENALTSWELGQKNSLSNWTTEQKTAFTTWLQSCKDALGDSAAATLAATASAHEERLTLLEQMALTNDWWAYIVDDSGNPILDDDGNAIVGDWHYKYA